MKIIIPEGPETRINQSIVEVRAAEGTESRRIFGVAAKVNSMSQVLYGSFREIIEPGAFESADMSDVVALKNHSFNLILARNLGENPTLELRINASGDFEYEFDAPNTTTGNDTLEEVRTRLIPYSSFSFTVSEYRWDTDDEGFDLRRILKFKRIYDVSPVVNPAYLETSVNARNMDVVLESLKEYKKGLNPDSFAARNLAELELKIKRQRFNF